MSEVKKVYEAINAVHKEIAEKGIAKNQENTFDRYKFRGIDDVYNALAPILAKNKLIIIPTIANKDSEVRETQKGGSVFHVTLHVEYTFVSVEDGSEYKVTMLGEAMDRGDKALSKALSAAFKNLAFQTFTIPTDAAPDADSETHELAAIEKHESDNALQKAKGSVFEKAIKYDQPLLASAFNDHGFESTEKNKEDMLRTLLHKVDSKEKLIEIANRTKELQGWFDRISQFDVECIGQAFEEDGFDSDSDDKDTYVSDLITQVYDEDKMESIISKIKKFQEDLDATTITTDDL